LQFDKLAAPDIFINGQTKAQIGEIKNVAYQTLILTDKNKKLPL
jgi:hypothetical protein